MRNERDRARADADTWRAAFEQELAQRALPAPGNVAQAPETTPAMPASRPHTSARSPVPPRVSALPLAPRLALDADDRVTANGARGRPRLRAGEGAGSQAARSEAALAVISTLRRGPKSGGSKNRRRRKPHARGHLNESRRPCVSGGAMTNETILAREGER
jgi:hypothetical protein